jgi:hypothetical protein
MLATRSNASRARHRRNRDATHAFPGAGGAECASAGGASPICGARRRSRSLSPPERDLWPSGSKVAHERAITQPRILARLRRSFDFFTGPPRQFVATDGAEANSRRGLATVLAPLAWQNDPIGRKHRVCVPARVRSEPESNAACYPHLVPGSPGPAYFAAANPTMHPRSSSQSFKRAHRKLVLSVRRGARCSSGLDSNAARSR